MVRLGAVGRDHDEDSDDDGNVENQRPIRVEGEPGRHLDVRQNCRNEGYYPCELQRGGAASAHRSRRTTHSLGPKSKLTVAIEIVARANGSPMMFPKLMRLRPYWALEYSIFPSDGERSEP